MVAQRWDTQAARASLMLLLVVMVAATFPRWIPAVEIFPATRTAAETGGPTSTSIEHRAREAMAGMPLQFIPNTGRAPGEVAFYLPGSHTSVWFTPQGLTASLSMPGQGSDRWTVALDFIGAAPVVPIGTGPSSSNVSYFNGSPDRWATGVPAFTAVTYPQLWPGIDLTYTGRDGRLKYEFVVHPGADPSQIRLAYRGAGAPALNPGGDLVLTTPAGAVTDERPYTYQQVGGARQQVASAYALGEGGAHTYGFAVGHYDTTLPLVIDPAVLVRSGYIGSTGFEHALGAATDASGSLYVTGETNGTEASFPVTVGPDTGYNGTGDAFVAKITPDGSGFAYVGYIGGNGFDQGMGIAVDGTGAAYISGMTGSTEATFPVTGGPDTTYNGGERDAFVAKVSPDGAGLEYAGYIGGAANDLARGIAVDSTGAAYLTGQTNSTEATFPVAGGVDNTYNGGANDAFVAKVNPDGTGLQYAGYIGGNDDDLGFGLAIDAAGAAYVSGQAASTQATFPVATGPDLTFNGGFFDAFVTKVNPGGSGLAYSGYIGGNGLDGSYAIAVDSAGAAYLTGGTISAGATFPVAGGLDATYNGGLTDAFVAKVVPSGANLAYAGYLGGAGYDVGFGIAVDASGAAYVTGETASTQTTFPVTGGPDATFNGGGLDAFASKIRPDGSGLEYSGFIGGAGYDQGLALTLGTGGELYVVGETSSTPPSFPVATGPDLTYNGGSADAFAVKIEVREASLSITKSCSPTPVAPTGTVTCSVTVTNSGPSAAANVRVADTLDAGLSLSGTASGGGFNCTSAPANPRIVCTLASLPVGSATIDYSLAVSEDAAPGSSLPNSVTVTSDSTTPAPSHTTGASVSVVACTVSGTAGNDVLAGTGGDDVICGGGGHDTITGGAGHDIIIGGTGDDKLDGSAGDDLIIAGPGHDQLIGGDGADRLYGGAGNDLAWGGAGDDQMFGGDGWDSLSGDAGQDSADGGAPYNLCWAETRVNC